MEIALVLGLLVAAVALFAWEKLSVDIITLLLLIVLVVSGILTPGEAFAGFSSDIIIILGSIFVISGALQETGVLDAIGTRVLKAAGNRLNRLLAILMGTAGGISAFMNNTTVTAMFLSPVVGISRKAKISGSKLLMPLAYASILGGTCSLIGTSTNVAVSGYIENSGMRPLGMFEITPVGIIILGVGILYMIFIGKKILPDHGNEELIKDYAIRDYLSEIIVMPGSPLIGQRSYESDLSILNFRILKIIRDGKHLHPSARLLIEKEDVLLVQGKVDDLMKVKKIEGIEIKAEQTLGDKDLQDVDMKVGEVIITPSSALVGRTLKEADFRRRSGLTVLAIHREGQSLRDAVGDVTIQPGDLFLLQGPEEHFSMLRDDPGTLVLEEKEELLYDPRKGMLAIGFFLAAIMLGSFGWLPLSVVFLAAAVLTILLRCLSIEKAYEFIDWRLLILIGGMTAFGTAMEKTGAAEFLGSGVAHYMEPFGPMAIMAGFFVLTIFLTQPMSNAAAALVMLPIAISTANQIGVDPRTYAISIMLAASVSLVTPFEPACILVYGPGKYQFRDFVKTGVGLTLILSVITLCLIPYFWPLYP